MPGFCIKILCSRNETVWSRIVQKYFCNYEYFYSTAFTLARGPTQPPVMGTRGSFPGVKWQGLEADQSPPPGAKVKNGGAIPLLPTPPLFMLTYLSMGNATLTLPFLPSRKMKVTTLGLCVLLQCVTMTVDLT
jgi:hypothetical protein